ncbi:MurR/RpiR family transcriptional regulator [Bradyrhizobium sp. RDT10]
MVSVDLVEEIKEVCVDLSGQNVQAAHCLINNPDEAAFHWMREIARRANVPPVSFVRLAQRLGLAGYSELRQRFIDLMRDRRQSDRLSLTRNQQSARALLRKMGDGAGLEDFVESFFAAEIDVVRQARVHLSEEKLKEAVDLLANAQKVFVYGRRTAFTLAYTLGACLSSDWSRGCESDSLRGHEQGISPLEDRRGPASAAERAGLCAAGPRFAVDRVAGQGKP